MKISHFPKWLGRVYDSINVIEVLLAIAILGLLAAVVIPNVVRAREQTEKNKIEAQQKATVALHVGDTVTIKGIDQKGTVNYFPDNGYVDVLIIGKNGEPTILKGINATLITK